MKRLNGLIVLVVCIAWLAACAAPTPPTPSATQAPQPTAPAPTPSKTSGDQLPPFLPAVQQFAAQKYGASADELKIMNIQPVDWPDSCLGAAQPGEICAQVVTPGYLLTVEIKGKTYELHTDSGKFVRLANPAPVGGESNPAAETARLWMMDSLKIDASTIQVISVTAKDWPDGCLGVHKPGQACTAAIVSGYRVILTVRGVAYELRTNQDGKLVVLVNPFYQVFNPQLPSLERPQITWKSGDQNCMLVQAMEDQAAFGPCGGALKIVKIANPDRVKELALLAATYHPFTSQTPAGEVAYYGAGTMDATPAQQRALAEWAQMLYLETSSGVVQPNQGLALTWQRAGGIVGFCDDLKIYRSGLAVYTSCKGGTNQPAAWHWLNPDQLVQLYTWLDTLQTFDGKQGDTAVADAMTISWMLSANGTRTATDSDRQAINNFASLIVLSPK